MNTTIQEGYNSSFRLADDAFSNTTVIKEKVTDLDDAFYKPPVKSDKFKVETPICKPKKAIALPPQSKEEVETELLKFKKFDYKISPTKRKKIDVKKTLDNLFLNRNHRTNEENTEKPKIDLLSKPAILEFRLNLKKPS